MFRLAIRLHVLLLAAIVPPLAWADAPKADRLTPREAVDPYYPHKDYPKLLTPQWVGEPGVEAVVVLAIDDMSDPAKYERYLRPILDRLKKIDGRAPVSIMTNKVKPDDSQLQAWLKEGLSFECHTLTHPCPLLQQGNFPAAERTYHECVDLMNQIPGNQPVAFRMPCCDSINSPSPRFYAEIFNKTSPAGKSLTIDSSVFMIFTPDDPSLPPNLVLDSDGRERFRKYLPFPSFVNTIENYPYPYLIGGQCWEFPCVVPSDWEAQNIQKPNNPKTVEDLKAALDLVVHKQGVFNLVFHPHGWIKNEQVVELIDHAVKTHGNKIKFLNFHEANDRLNVNLLRGKPLRNADGSSSAIRLADTNGDGLLEAVEGPATTTLKLDAPLPPGASWVDANGKDAGLRLVDIDEDGFLDVVFSNDEVYGVYLFEPEKKDWSRRVMAGTAGAPGGLPKIVRNGTNNGFFVHSRSLWWQNEDTAKLPDLVDRRSFNDLLKNIEPRGKSPKASLDSIRVTPGFRVEQVVTEPLVKDPIAFEWGADGKLWVVQMGDYPLGDDGKGKAGGVVRVLEDQNGDGNYDRATTFLDGLGFPTGVMPWRGGVLVACAPDILYAEDTDGDGRADSRKVLFTGFVEGNQQHRLNGFELGLDGWVYGANGDSGGTVRSVATGKTVSINGRDFRFKPDSGEFESETGQTQFGRRRDDWGNWFGNNNPNWGWRFVLAESDLKRNPHFAPPDARVTLEPDTKLYPLSRTLERFNEPGSANQVTSANSPTPYRDDLFGAHYANSLFVSEPVHNLVHWMILEPNGSVMKGHRAPGEERREFLASSDNWFRPTMLKTGPDGALWISDMYRAVIEHPQWIPPAVQARIDLRAGSQEGRIYRVLPVSIAARPIPRLDRLDTTQLVAALDSPSGWQRDTVMRLLLHRRDPAASEPLKALARTSKRPQTRLQAIWCLSHADALDEPTAKAALADAHPQVRRNAVKASESILTRWSQVADAVVGLADDADASVRLQVALSLGNWSDERAAKALARIALRDSEDRWILAAVLSSSLPHVTTLLTELFHAAGERPLPGSTIEALVRTAMLAGDRQVLDTLAKPAGQGGTFASWQIDAYASLLVALRTSKRPQQAEQLPFNRAAFSSLEATAKKLIENDQAPEAERLAAIRVAGALADQSDTDRDLLFNLLRPQSSAAIVAESLSSLGRTSHRAVPQRLLNDWKGFTPSARLAVLDLLLSRPEWTRSLLSSLEDTCVAATEIDATHRDRLLSNSDADMKARAQTVFAVKPGKRKDVVDAYQPVIKQAGNREKGRAVFEKTCSACHRLGGVGVEVGPDLAALKDKSPESLLIAILDPNRAFEAKFTSFNLATTDGRVVSGMIAAESANAITIRVQGGKDETFLRSQVEQLAGSGKSLMPEGLENDLTRENIADLIAFLASTPGAAASSPAPASTENAAPAGGAKGSCACGPKP